MLDTPTDVLDLADYRRRMAAVHVEVRRLLAVNRPVEAWHAWRDGRDALFRDHPQSPWAGRPVRPATIPVFDHDPAWSLVVAVEPPTTEEPLRLPHSGRGGTAARPVGTVVVAGTPLTLYWLEQYGGGLFLPFRDATSGHETYGGGRYLLDGAKSADLGAGPDGGELVLDLNFAYHPSCAHDPRWSCPLAPATNVLEVPVRAGERLARPSG